VGGLTLACSCCVALLLASAAVPGSAQQASEAAVLVRQLGQFRAEIDPRIDKRTGQPLPVEQRRQAIYAKLRILGDEAVSALQQGLTDPDVAIRQNVALFLSFEGGNYAKRAEAALDVTPFLPQLVVALRDGDEWVAARAAQAIAHAGPKGVIAVGGLIRLLEDRRVGARIGACIGLAGIGPAARDALPALRRALRDPHEDVRRFAQRAIGRIEAKPRATSPPVPPNANVSRLPPAARTDASAR
jgi:HEAT repeat protein